MALRDLLADAVTRAAAVERELLDPKTVRDGKLLASLGREHQRLGQVVDRATRLTKLDHELKGALELLAMSGGDEEHKLYEDEVVDLRAGITKLEAELTPMVIPHDPLDDRNCIVELRAGTGGDEAALFAADIWRMYTRYIERLGWKAETISMSDGTLGGIKEVIFKVSGTGAFGQMRWESGVHRVQRVPATETAGRIHTSAATVAVLPEADEIDLKIEDKDLRIDVFRSSGPGGQSVNTTDSAVRITHIPSGIVVSQQDQKSQLQNKLKGMEVLRARLLDSKIAAQEAERSRMRRSQVSTGDRSAKIRTYNYPQSRVTDHRINFTTHNLPAVMNGEIGPLIEALKHADVEEKLSVGGD